MALKIYSTQKSCVPRYLLIFLIWVFFAPIEIKLFDYNLQQIHNANIHQIRPLGNTASSFLKCFQFGLPGVFTKADTQLQLYKANF